MQAREGLPFVTLTDFNQPGRREGLTHHATADNARRAWKRTLVPIYGPKGSFGASRLWLEEKSTGRVLMDTGPVGPGYDTGGNYRGGGSYIYAAPAPHPQPFPQPVERDGVAALPQPGAPGVRKLNLGNE